MPLSCFQNTKTLRHRSYVCVCDDNFGEYWCLFLASHIQANEISIASFGTYIHAFLFQIKKIESAYRFKQSNTYKSLNKCYYFYYSSLNV